MGEHVITVTWRQGTDDYIVVIDGETVAKGVLWPEVLELIKRQEETAAQKL